MAGMAAVVNNVDVMHHLLRFCADAATVVAARKTCTLFRDAATDDVLRAVAHWRTLPRDLHPYLPPPTCLGCKRTVKGISWRCTGLHCADCRCITLLPLPRPVVKRFTQAHVHYTLPSTPHLIAAQFWSAQESTWRDTCATTNRLVCRRARHKDAVVEPAPMRIAGRLEQCTCGANDAFECLHAGKCLWTPWSEGV
jgi:hypothetical protein